MKYTLNFKELGKNDALVAGGKGASLGEMIRAGIPVPDGFVILADTFDLFLKETDLLQEIEAILDGVNHEAIHTVEAASESIQGLILSRPIPEVIQKEIQEKFADLGSQYVAVRSSATAEDGIEHAWAGQLDSYLNTTERDLIEKVRKCWASLFTPRAIFYRFEKGLHSTKISVAVVVQSMVNSEKSGIAFSVHPVTEDYNQLIIEAGFGLGEAIVSGAVTPDSYVVEKSPWKILDINISHQGRALYRIDGGGNEWRDLGESFGSNKVLNEAQIQELSDIIVQIEKHYGFPCDIEWAFEDGKFFIVQSRPITTLSTKGNINLQKIEKIFSRDFTMIALEMDYRMEYQRARPWTKGENPYSPYLVFWRNDGTNKIYFNSKGVEWIQGELEKRVRENKDFLKLVEENVRKGISYIRPVYEAEKAIDRESLIRFVEEFMAAYFWIEAMWWIKGMADENLKDIDCANIVRLREETETLSAATDRVIRKSLEKLYPKLGLLSAMISFDELKGGNIPSEEVLRTRDQGFVLINNEIIIDKNFDDVLKENGLELVEESFQMLGEELEGQSASKGRHTGRVVRVMGHNDFEKVQEGDVLVSPMTMVDFLPVMKIAGAFVTDEGGALCHAAIVARELGKPCVIGAKIATQALKDGDMVEVDADHGEVRILKDEPSGATVFPSVDGYTKFGRWVAPTIEVELWLDWSHTPEAAKLDVPYNPNPDVVSLDGHFFVRNTGAYPYIQERILEEFRLGKTGYADAILDIAQDLSEKCTERALQIGTHSTIKDLDRDFDLMRRLRFPWWACFALSDAADTMIEVYAKEQGLSIDDITAALPQLPSSLTRDQEALQSFRQEIESAGLPFDLVAIEKANPELVARLVSYQKQTEYLGTHHFWGEARLIPVFMDALQKAHAAEGHESVHAYTDIEHVLKAAGRGAQLRLECAQSGARLAYAWRPFLESLAEQVGLTYDEIIFLTLDEIKEAYTSKSVDISMVKDRAKKAGIYKTDDAVKVLWGQELEDHLEQFVPEETIVDVDELKGNIANKGKAQGRVVIVLTPKDAERVEKGTVLVAPETTPDFIPAMGRAVAFVTDRGGITSHAAIVAREMKKPCIIGTKIATQVLRDGDFIEVDADNGVVRILERNSSVSSEAQWEHYLTRSFTLFQTSLWHMWYTSSHAEEILGGRAYDAFYRQTGEQEVEHMRPVGQIATWKKNLVNLYENNPEQLASYLQQGFEYNECFVAEETTFHTLEEAVEFSRGMAIHATIVPLLVGEYILERETESSPLYQDVITLRSRSYYGDVFNQYIIPLAKKRLESQNVDVNLLPFVAYEELASITEQELLQRKRCHDEGKYFVYTCTKDVQVLQYDTYVSYKDAIQNQKELKGSVAFKGKVTGEVCIINTTAQIDKMKEGSILVSINTNPSLMSAIQKAGAIVTDEGGITCHAAIISRELKKPCVIGTKVATKVLKDGDLVEVDAETGVVRILSLDGIRALKKEDIILSDWEFEAQQRGEQPISLCDFFSRAVDQNMFSIVGGGGHYDYLFTDGDKLNCNSALRDKLVAQLKESMLDRKKRKEFLRDSFYIPANFNAVADEIQATLSSEISNQELARLWRNMDRDYLTIIPWFFYPWYVSKENILTDQVKVRLEKHKSKIQNICDLDEALLAVVFPVKKTNFQREQEEMLGLVKIARKNPDFTSDATFQKKAAEYLKKYDYLTTFILSPLLTMTYEQLVERVQNAVNESFEENYLLQKEANKKNEERASKVLEVLQGDEELLEWIEDSRELGYALTAGIEEAYISSARYLPFMQVVAERIGIVFEDLKYLLSSEVSRALDQNFTIAPEKIDVRREGFVLMMKVGVQYALFGKEGHALSQWIDSELNKIDTSIQEFSGQSACKGSGKGKVRIATTPTQAHALQEGEILVCPMTNPDYVPAMRRSAAIITDEGGLLSHAAIMSREFGKPCVIGTKIATQLLKDGDLVEVDAEQGVVKIITRA